MVMGKYKWIRVSTEVHIVLTEIKKTCYCNGFDTLFKLLLPTMKEFSENYIVNLLGDRVDG